MVDIGAMAMPRYWLTPAKGLGNPTPVTQSNAGKYTGTHHKYDGHYCGLSWARAMQAVHYGALIYRWPQVDFACSLTIGSHILERAMAMPR